MFSLANVVFDLFNGMYNAAMVRTISATLITTALNFLCSKNMSIISWFIVFLPFLLMTYLVGILLFTLGLDPTTGPIDIEYPALLILLKKLWLILVYKQLVIMH